MAENDKAEKPEADKAAKKLEGLDFVGRLALRIEGEWWEAYYALPDTMEDAIPLGRIRIGAAQANQEVKHGFVELMKMIIADALKESVGPVASWRLEDAPDNERSGAQDEE